MRRRHLAAVLAGMMAALVVSTWVGEDVEKFSTVHTPKPMFVSPLGETFRETKRSISVCEPTSAYDGRGYEAPDKEKLIIQQNPECWIGVPGATCKPGTRTFLGQ